MRSFRRYCSHKKEYLKDREHLFLSEDASGELLGMYGLHETLESLREDLEGHVGHWRGKDRQHLAEVMAVVQQGVDLGLRYGAEMRVTLLETI